MSVGLPEETKEKLREILQYAASNDHCVVEFKREDGQLYASDITDHLNELESER
jgi:hypothetical protein